MAAHGNGAFSHRGERESPAANREDEQDQVAACSDLEQLAVIAENLSAQLTQHAQICRQIRDGIHDGEGLDTLLGVVKSDQWRPSMTASIEEFESFRAKSRLTLVALARTQGMTVTDVAQRWCVSRQLASRWFHKLDEEAAAHQARHV